MKRLKAITYAFSPWLTAIGLFVIWELAVRLFSIPQFILPAPSVIVQETIRFWPGIWYNALQTLMTTVLGFLLAVAFGLVSGTIVGASPLLNRSLNPIMIGFNSIPKVAVVPILVLWFGIGTVPAVITAFLVAFFPVMVNVATGIATLEPELADVLRSLGARKKDILIKIGIPRSLPYFFASLKVAITLAFVGSVIAETVASNKGIGYLMMSASATFRVPLVFSGLMVVAIMGIMMYWVAALIERRMTHWTVRDEAAVAYSAG